MSRSDKKCEHPPLSSTVEEQRSSSHVTHQRQFRRIKMHNLSNGVSIASSSSSSSLSSSSSTTIKQTNTHRSCLKHRPDGSYQRENNCQPITMPQDDGTAGLSTGGNTSGRVSFAHAPLSDGRISQESTFTLPTNSERTEKQRRSIMFARKARELQLAEFTYFKEHARDIEPPDE